MAVRIKPHPVFVRSGNDILYGLRINIAKAALGASLEVPTIDGSVELKIPPGTQPKDILRLKGKGVPHLRSRQRGDQLVEIVVEVPRSLTEEQQELLERLAASLSDYEPAGDDKSWFGKFKDAFAGDDG